MCVLFWNKLDLQFHEIWTINKIFYRICTCIDSMYFSKSNWVNIILPLIFIFAEHSFLYKQEDFYL